MSANKLSKFRPQRQNPNKHTERGLKMLVGGMGEVGYVAPMTAAADGEIIDGSARLEVVADVFRDIDPIVIEHDGTRPVVMIRTDVPNADSPIAKRISIEANRVGEVDLAWDVDILSDFSADGLLDGLFSEDELGAILQTVPDIDFKEYDESVANDVEYITCPNCQHRWPK